MANKNKSVVAIIMMFFLFAMIAFVTNLCSPMAVIVKNQFGASNSAAQLGNSANFLAYLIMGIPSGMLIKKIGYKNTALTAIAIGFIGVLIQYVSGFDQVQSFWVYIIGAFIAGLCMCMLNAVVNPMLNTLGGGGNRGNQLVQFGGVCNSFAAVAVTIMMGSLIGDATKAKISDATPALFIALGVFAVAFVVLLVSDIEDPEDVSEPSTEVKKNTHEQYSAFSFRHFVLGIIAIFCYLGVEVGIPTYALQYLVTAKDATTPGLGIDATIGGTIVAVYWFLMLIGRLLGGAVAGNMKSSTQITVVAITAMVAVGAGMTLPQDITISMPGINWSSLSVVTAEVPMSIFFFIIVGLCTSVMWGGIFNMAVEGLGKYTSIASGAFMTMVFGGAVLVPLQGLIADKTGNYLTSFVLTLVLLAYILYYALIGHRNVNTDIPTT